MTPADKIEIILDFINFLKKGGTETVEPIVENVIKVRKKYTKKVKDTDGRLYGRTIEKLKELKAAGMSSKDAAEERGVDLEIVNKYWPDL